MNFERKTGRKINLEGKKPQVDETIELIKLSKKRSFVVWVEFRYTHRCGGFSSAGLRLTAFYPPYIILI